MPKAKADTVPGSGWFHVVDRVFFTLLVLSLACHFGLIAAVGWRTPEPDEDFQPLIPDVWVRQVIAKPAPKPVPGTALPEATLRQVGPKSPRPKLDHAGLLGVIGAMTSEAGSGLGDLLKEGAASNDLAQAFQGIDHVATAGPDTGLRSRHGAGSGTISNLDDIGTGGAGKIDLGPRREGHISGTVSPESPQPESKDIDRDAMGRFVKAHLRAIQTCYERQLKLLPDLRGKLGVRLTLTPGGRVGELEIDEDTLQNGAVVDCIRSVLHGWQLPFRPEAESAVQLSWDFVAGN